MLDSDCRYTDRRGTEKELSKPAKWSSMHQMAQNVSQLFCNFFCVSSKNHQWQGARIMKVWQLITFDTNTGKFCHAKLIQLCTYRPCVPKRHRRHNLYVFAYQAL